MMFTIIIPTYNRPKALLRCLEALQYQSFSGEAEIIVVDDGGNAPLEGLTGRLGGRFPIRVIRQPNSGPGAARNTGAKSALGAYLVFTDDDCIPWKDFLEDYRLGFQQSPKALLGGRVRTQAHENLLCQTSQLVLDMALGFFNHTPDNARFFASNNFAVPRLEFLELHGFLAREFRIASEDREFCDRWRHQGMQLRSLPGAAVFHSPSLNLASYCRMYFRYGRGAFRYQEIRKQRGSGSLREDSRFHLQLPRLVGKSLNKFSATKRFAVLGLLALWQLANLAGFLYEGYLARGKCEEGTCLVTGPFPEIGC